MKNLNDLFQLIQNETEMNEGKLVKNTFSIDTHYMWVSMWRQAGDDEPMPLMSTMSIRHEHELQLAYWTIVDQGRTGSLALARANK